MTKLVCDLGDERVAAATITVRLATGSSTLKDVCAEHLEALEKWLSGERGAAFETVNPRSVPVKADEVKDANIS